MWRTDDVLATLASARRLAGTSSRLNPALPDLVGRHLLEACNHWADTGEEEFELFHLRDRERQESYS